jgi:hypothetical protein
MTFSPYAIWFYFYGMAASYALLMMIFSSGLRCPTPKSAAAVRRSLD